MEYMDRHETWCQFRGRAEVEICAAVAQLSGVGGGKWRRSLDLLSIPNSMSPSEIIVNITTPAAPFEFFRVLLLNLRLQTLSDHYT